MTSSHKRLSSRRCQGWGRSCFVGSLACGALPHTALPGSFSASQPRCLCSVPWSPRGWSDSNRAQLSLDIVTRILSSQAVIVPSRTHKLQPISFSICPRFACFSILTEMRGKPQDFPCLIPSSCLLLYYEYIHIYIHVICLFHICKWFVYFKYLIKMELYNNCVYVSVCVYKFQLNEVTGIIRVIEWRLPGVGGKEWS